MKTIKSIILLFSLCLLVQCKSIQFEKSPPFKILGANYSQWVGGQPGISGTKIGFQFTTDKPVIFDSIYFQKKTVKAELRVIEGKRYAVGFINTSKRPPTVGAVKAEPKNTSYPFELKPDEAVLSYTLKGKKRYFKVANLKVGPSRSYQ